MGSKPVLTLSVSKISVIWVSMVRIRECLTKVQFRRLWMYYAEGMTEQEIAKREGVGQQRISKSLISAKKKLANVTKLENRG